MKIFLSLILLSLSISFAYAKSFGVIGEVFPVAEKSFLELIKERLLTLKASNELEVVNKRWVKTVASHANRPTPLGLTRTNYSKKYDYVPEITLSQDITDERGRVLYSKGVHENALAKIPSYKPCWLFFNADDEAQLKWANLQKKACSSPKFILTAGAISTTEQRLKTAIYFDQAGLITTKLHITHVPAKVERFQNHLIIHEVAIKEDGNVQ